MPAHSLGLPEPNIRNIFARIMALTFENFDLDPAARELRHDGTLVKMEPKVYELLVYLIENRARVLSRDDIIADVWKGRIVSDSAISSCIKAIRKAVNDDGSAQRLVKTVHGRGFRFVGEVSGSSKSGSSAENFSLSVNVPPLSVPSQEEALMDAAHSLSDDIATVLTRVPFLKITSDSSGSECTYRIEGTLKRRGQKLRLNLRLVRNETDEMEWSRPIDCDVDGDLEDNLFYATLPHLEAALVQTMLKDAAAAGGNNNVHARIIQASAILSIKGWNRTSFAESKAILRSVLEDAPNLVMARAYLALIMALSSRVGLVDASQDHITEAMELADQSLAEGGQSSAILGLAGCALSDLGQVDRAIPILKRAVEIDPNNAQAWAALGTAMMSARDLTDARKALERGIALSPMDARLAIWQSILAAVHLWDGDIETARTIAQSGCAADDRNHMPRVHLAAIEAAAGNMDAAQRAMSDAIRVRPDLTPTEVQKLIGRRAAASLDLSALSQQT